MRTERCLFNHYYNLALQKTASLSADICRRHTFKPESTGKCTVTSNDIIRLRFLNLSQNLKQDRQWRILEVSAPLKSNTYMIRNLNGTALHMKPGGEVSTEKVHKGAHEKVL